MCDPFYSRTGTFIIIDQVITALSMNDNKIDINGLVEEIREDRMALVQHTIQYKFAYQACVFYATKSQKGKEIFALESKKGGGIGRARRESMKPGGQYVSLAIYSDIQLWPDPVVEGAHTTQCIWGWPTLI